MSYRSKFVNVEAKVLDKEEGTIRAVVSTENVDRDGDVIRQDGWDLRHFKAHPVLLSSHNYRGLTNQIGEWVSMDVVDKELVGHARYYIGEGNPEADWGFFLAGRDRAAFSVGFMPDMSQAKQIDANGNISYEFQGQELLEVSQVTVPSNRQSLQAMKSVGLDPEIETFVDGLLHDMEEEPELPTTILSDEIAQLIREEVERLFVQHTLSFQAYREPSINVDQVVRDAIRQTLKLYREAR